MNQKENKTNWDEIRNGVNLEKLTPEKLRKVWGEVFGKNNRIRREKFVIINDELQQEVRDEVLEEVHLRETDEAIFIVWSDGNMDKAASYTTDDFMGVQTHENRERSVILSHNSKIDPVKGAKQTVRRFTAVPAVAK